MTTNSFHTFWSMMCQQQCGISLRYRIWESIWSQYVDLYRIPYSLRRKLLAWAILQVPAKKILQIWAHKATAAQWNTQVIASRWLLFKILMTWFIYSKSRNVYAVFLISNWKCNKVLKATDYLLMLGNTANLYMIHTSVRRKKSSIVYICLVIVQESRKCIALVNIITQRNN